MIDCLSLLSLAAIAFDHGSSLVQGDLKNLVNIHFNLGRYLEITHLPIMAKLPGLSQQQSHGILPFPKEQRKKKIKKKQKRKEEGGKKKKDPFA